MGINSKVKMIPLIEFTFKIVPFLSVFLGAKNAKKDIWILNVDTQNIEKINEIC